jgi:hypothetical protein
VVRVRARQTGQQIKTHRPVRLGIDDRLAFRGGQQGLVVGLAVLQSPGCAPAKKVRVHSVDRESCGRTRRVSGNQLDKKRNIYLAADQS